MREKETTTLWITELKLKRLSKIHRLIKNFQKICRAKSQKLRNLNFKAQSRNNKMEDFPIQSYPY